MYESLMTRHSICQSLQSVKIRPYRLYPASKFSVLVRQGKVNGGQFSRKFVLNEQKNTAPVRVENGMRE